MSDLKLTVLCPDRRLIQSVGVKTVYLTGSEGQIEILPDHASMVGNLEPGIFKYTPLDSETSIAAFVSSGFFEVEKNHVFVMAEHFEFGNEIDHERAKQAQQKAESKLKDIGIDEFEKYGRKLQRAMLRQQISMILGQNN